MPLKPFINYYGSKYGVANHYPAPLYPVIVEPFAGSAGYSLHYHTKQVKLYEKYDVLVQIWNYLINASPYEIMRLPLTWPRVDMLQLPEAVKNFLGFNCSISQANLYQVISNYGEKNRADIWGARKRQIVAEQVSLIKHWTCERVVQYWEAPDIEATWFIDPPYADTNTAPTLAYRSMIKKKNRSDPKIDYAFLANWCRSRKGQVIICDTNNSDWFDFRHEFRNNGTRNRKYREAYAHLVNGVER